MFIIFKAVSFFTITTAVKLSKISTSSISVSEPLMYSIKSKTKLNGNYSGKLLNEISIAPFYEVTVFTSS